MAQAGGKVILLGEHAVVHGVEAIAVGLTRGVRAEARRAESPRGQATLSINGRRVEASDLTDAAFRDLVLRLEAPPCEVSVQLDMPGGVGLGASAAIGVAVARSLAELTDLELSRSSLLAAVNAWEAVFHGNPSGIDAACSALGGCIRFSKSEGPVALSLGRPLRLAIAVAGPASSTKEMVAKVAALASSQPSQFRYTLDAIADLVNSARAHLATGDTQALGVLLNANHQLLSEHWQLSTPEIERACEGARNAGALGAKVTGAGGGGCVVALCPDTGPEEVLEAWHRLGYNCFGSNVECSSLGE